MMPFKKHGIGLDICVRCYRIAKRFKSDRLSQLKTVLLNEVLMSWCVPVVDVLVMFIHCLIVIHVHKCGVTYVVFTCVLSWTCSAMQLFQFALFTLSHRFYNVYLVLCPGINNSYG